MDVDGEKAVAAEIEKVPVAAAAQRAGVRGGEGRGVDDALQQARHSMRAADRARTAAPWPGTHCSYPSTPSKRPIGLQIALQYRTFNACSTVADDFSTVIDWCPRSSSRLVPSSNACTFVAILSILQSLKNAS